MRQTIFIIEAVKSLRPNSIFSIENNDYAKLCWHEDNTEPAPTKQEVLAEADRLKQEYDNQFYKQERAAEYPPVEDFLDAIVKGDEEQKQAYIDACLAVKAKYPKPEGV